MIYPFRNYIGIEYLENLHNIGLTIKEKFDVNPESFSKENPYLVPNFTFNQNIELICGDFLSMDWSDASFLFANSTCFSADLMQSLSKKRKNCQLGLYLLHLLKNYPCYLKIGKSLMDLED